jgi:hypothetical protein
MSVNYIGRLAFGLCTSLSDIEFQDGDNSLTIREERGSSFSAFSQCPISKVYLGRNIINNSYNYIYSSLASITIIKEGDINGDDVVDISDAVCIVSHMLGKEMPTFIEAAADVNADGEVDIADAVHIVNLVIGKVDALDPQTETNLQAPQ